MSAREKKKVLHFSKWFLDARAETFRNRLFLTPEIAVFAYIPIIRTPGVPSQNVLTDQTRATGIR